MHHIMIVEDEERIRQGLCYIIENLIEGWEVSYAAENGLEALEMLSSHPVELIITDISMAQMNGLQLIEKVHECYPQVLTIILTGHASFNYAQSAIRCGVVDYILKPLSPQKLRNALQRVEAILQQRRFAPLSLSANDSERLLKIENLFVRAIVSQNTAGMHRALREIQSLTGCSVTEKLGELHTLYQFSLSRILDSLAAEGRGTVDKTVVYPEVEKLMLVRNEEQWEEWLRTVCQTLQCAFVEAQNDIHQVVREVVEHMRTHYGEQITLESLAARFNISGNYLSDLFKKEMGIGYREYLTRLRIQQAKQLLVSDKKPTLQEVAEQVGYANERYFVDVFKKEMGMTPGEYKRQKGAGT